MTIATTSLVLAEGGGLGINALGFLSQLISFIIVFWILWKWAFPLITKTLEQRQTVIREGIENAEKAKRDLAEAKAGAERILADARVKGQETIERAQKAAQQEEKRIIEEAHARAEQVAQQQIARIQQEANRARIELSRMVVDLSIGAAGKVVGRTVDSRDNRRLVEEFVSASDQARNN